MAEHVRLWLPWPGRGYPASAHDEAAFAADLEALPASSGRARDWDRSDVTVVATALRGGASVEDVVSITPGSDGPSLLAAYTHLADTVAASGSAWRRIRRRPRPGVVTEAVFDLAPCLLVPASLLAQQVLSRPKHLAELVSNLSERVDEVRRRVQRIEEALTSAGSRELGVTWGARLYHPLEDCHFGNPFFLPVRVAEMHHRHVELSLSERSLPGSLVALAAAEGIELPQPVFPPDTTTD